ncbi:PfkB family carbohydrate kinase [Rheinheimera gaetbuli]
MLAVIGENVVDMLPGADGFYRACLGGSPFNVAIAAARQNVAVCYLSPLSQDHFGQQFAHYLADNGGAYGPAFFSSAPTSVAMVSINAQRQPQYSLYRQGIADRDISAAQQIAALPSACKLLHLGSLALEPQDGARVTAVIAACQARQVQLAVDINVRINAVTDVVAYRALLLQVIAQSHFIKASDEDLQLLFPELNLTQALGALRDCAPHALLALTEGEKGASLYWQQHHISLPVIAATPFVDTVGAGDTFWANLLAALLKLGLPTAADISTAQLTLCLQRAMLAASLNIAKAGCNPPHSAELTAALVQLQTASQQ